jgi:alanine racemase
VLQYNKIDYLAVAFTDEGVNLRQNGIHIPVMVMNPGENDFLLLTEYNLEPELYNFHMLREFQKYLNHHGMKQYPVHIKFDTGMNRLGFKPGDADKLAEELRSSNFRIASVFSHLAAADEQEHDAFTLKQIELFNEMSGKIRNAVNQSYTRHILNTSGIERFPDAQMEMVRLGIGLYGISRVYGEKLTEVSRLRTSITQINELSAGETVGYGRQGKVTGRMKVATLPVGYADGIPRSLGNGKGKFIVNGNACPVIGNVCMDMCMIDVTGIPVAEDDEVILFGREWPVSQLAGWAGTIPYELLTNVSERVKRVYYQD